jgi:hypothetical protein
MRLSELKWHNPQNETTFKELLAKLSQTLNLHNLGVARKLTKAAKSRTTSKILSTAGSGFRS